MTYCIPFRWVCSKGRDWRSLLFWFFRLKRIDRITFHIYWPEGGGRTGREGCRCWKWRGALGRSIRVSECVKCEEWLGMAWINELFRMHWAKRETRDVLFKLLFNVAERNLLAGWKVHSKINWRDKWSGILKNNLKSIGQLKWKFKEEDSLVSSPKWGGNLFIF